MSARVYFMKKVKDCKDVSIMSPQDEQWRRTSLLCSYTVNFLVLQQYACSRNINQQIVNIADENLTDYSFLSRYHYTKSKNYLKRRYRIRHWIPMFLGTPCRYMQKTCGCLIKKHMWQNSGCGCSETRGLIQVYTCGLIESQRSLCFYLNLKERIQPNEILVVHSTCCVTIKKSLTTNFLTCF